MRVEAFENAAVAAKAPATTRITRLKKETSALTTSSNGSSITPNIGKLGNPALGRFLTPTETANRTTNLGATKKITSSASKATMPLHKSTTASSLKNATVMGSMKNLQREYSADDVRKALKSQSEERKKQREQKHLLAAQQREAKERERAERFAKLAQEREEKRLKRQAEQEERKKREIEEMNRKLRLQEESAAVAIENKLKTAKAKGTAHEHEMAKQRMMPPPPKLQTKYRFEMLHEDDSTDEEGKTTYKRPPPPIWSRSHERGPAILMQQHTPLDVIDSFFSVQPLTANLKILFPTIDDRHLKRNSSVLWSTPPRYSELPKY
uniref:Inner centromere protein ARK-binding domain-containing protein n=1 Tax=Glossina brevipalpis TaxID=37001 RepID=A0A1A9WPB2_9MUSC